MTNFDLSEKIEKAVIYQVRQILALFWKVIDLILG